MKWLYQMPASSNTHYSPHIHIHFSPCRQWKKLMLSNSLKYVHWINKKLNLEVLIYDNLFKGYLHTTLFSFACWNVFELPSGFWHQGLEKGWILGLLTTVNGATCVKFEILCCATGHFLECKQRI